MLSYKFSVLLACTLSAHYALGQISLYLPGFDPQPLSANELGTGTDGRTTWEIQAGTPTGTEEVAFPGTATLVEGPSDAVIAYNIPALTLSVFEACSIVNGVAVCTAIANGATTVVETETANPFLVQGGATAVASVTSTAASSAATPTGSAATSSGFSTSTQASASSGSSASATTSATANGGSRAAAPFAAAVLGAAGIMMLML